MYSNRTRSETPTKLTPKDLEKMAAQAKGHPGWSYPAAQGIWGLIFVTALIVIAVVVL